MAARLVFLSGSKAGTTLELGQADVTIGRRPDRTVAYPPDEILVSTEHASVLYRNGRYTLRDDGSRNGTFVNSQIVEEKQLEHGDLIQFGPGGPSARFVMETKPGAVATLDIGTVTERRAAELAASGQPGPLTTRDLVALSYYKLSTRIRRSVIALVVLGVLVVGGLVLSQMRTKERVDRGLAEVAAAVTASRSEIEQSMAALDARYALLRDVVTAGEKSIKKGSRLNMEAVSQDSRGVALIVFSYGYTQRNGTALLRYELDPKGRVVTTRGRDGRPIPKASFGASGPPVQHQGTATAFLVDSSGYLIANRRAAEPWADAEELAVMRANGLDLVGHMVELRAYFPPGNESFVAVPDKKSDEADLAVFRVVGPVRAPALRLAPDSVLVRPGDQLISIGYPDDVRGLLFRLDTTARNDILRRTGSDTRALVEELARQHLVQPLVTDGSATTVAATGLTHTAGAAVGGMGGPLIARQWVVAVQEPVAAGAGAAARAQGVPIAFAWDVLPSHVKHSLGHAP